MLLWHFLFVFVAVSVLSNGNVAAQVHNEQGMWAKIDDSNSNVLYKVFIDEAAVEFTEAEEKCNAWMAHLASFHTIDELNFITNLVQQTVSTPYFPDIDEASFWLGLYHVRESVIGLPNYKLYFTDGTPYDLPHDTNNHSLVWVPIGHNSRRYEPNGFKNYDNTVEYCVESEYSYIHLQRRLNDVVCHKENKMYVCKRNGTNNFEVAELPSEVVTGEISQQKGMRPTQTTALATKSALMNTTLLPHTTLSTALKTKITSKSASLKDYWNDFAAKLGIRFVFGYF
ncbi:lectin c-type domain-containing protein [Ditylenchus destructor]|nr:lectin c-type domain-containing protein [Ditylenchus destructor]